MLERIVILSGITRGWEFSTASPDHVRFLAPILSRVCLIGGWLQNLHVRINGESIADLSSVPFIYQLKRGAPFVIATRTRSLLGAS
jgi:hypothetical protein